MAEARTWLAYFARHKKLLPVLKKADNIAVFIQLYWKIICLMLKYFTKFVDWDKDWGYIIRISSRKYATGYLPLWGKAVELWYSQPVGLAKREGSFSQVSNLTAAAFARRCSEELITFSQDRFAIGRHWGWKWENNCTQWECTHSGCFSRHHYKI